MRFQSTHAPGHPQVYISRFSRTDGTRVYQVIEQGRPLCAPTPRVEAAYAIYQARYEQRQLGRRGACAPRDIPELAPLWDGDAGRFIR